MKEAVGNCANTQKEKRNMLLEIGGKVILVI